MDNAVAFDGDDFDDYCRSKTGRTLRYVEFTLPDREEGSLQYDYRSSAHAGTPVSAGTSYYLSQNPRISRVSFVPADGFTGRVAIPFTGWDNQGGRFAGTVEVNVRISGGKGDVYYVCKAGKSVKLDNDDFNDLSEDITGERLNYIVFTGLPASGDGTLYHSRTSSSSGTRVARDTRYYNSRAPRIENLSFWAADNFSSDIEIPFTGYDLNGDSFTGTMVISARSGGGSSSSRSDIVYSTDYQEPVDFAARDFDELCYEETDEDLNYVRFDLPSSREGTLYYDYRASASSNAKVKESTNYYRSGSNGISRITFVPADGFSGYVDIDFTGYAKDGSRFTGTVEIRVDEDDRVTQGGRVVYTTRQAPVRLRASDFQGVIARGTLRSLRFGYLPPESAGRLYFRYNGPTDYAWQASASTEYLASGSPAISDLTFVPKAGYVGLVTVPYTATTTGGIQVTGDLLIYVEQGGGSLYFTDMGGYSGEAQTAVDYLKEQGVVSGITATTYGPQQSIRRGDFALMLTRAFRLTSSGGSGQRFSDVPADAYYADAVQTLRALGIVTGMGGNQYQPSGVLSRQDAMLMVQRAMRLAGWSASDGPVGALSAYSDGTAVSSYAQGAMAYMVQQGLLPISNGRLSPKGDLTRVDMAVLLHRAMTM